MRLALPHDRFRVLPAVVADVAPAVSLSVGIDDLLPPALPIHPDPVGLAHDGRGVDDKRDAFARARFAQEGDHGVVAVAEIDPLEAVVRVVLVEKGGLVFIDPVQVLDEALQAVVLGALAEMPVERLIVVPLAPLAEFAAHEEQLFPGCANIHA